MTHDTENGKRPRRPKGSGGVVNRGSDRFPRWTAYYYVIVEGARRQINKSGFTRKADAEDWLRDELQRLRAGRPTLPSKITVAELLDEWLAARRPSLEPNTYEEYSRIAEHRIKPHLGRRKVRGLQPDHVDQMLAALRRPGSSKAGRGEGRLSETSLQHTHATLRSALTFAVRQRIVSANVMDDVERPKREAREMQVWDAGQLEEFLGVAGDDRLFALIRLASHTGARRSELLGLQWKNVGLTAGTVTIVSRRTRVGYTMVRRAGTKTKAASRTIDLDSGTVEALKEWQKAQQQEREAWAEAYVESGYLFTAENGEPVHAEHVANRFDRLVADAKLPRIRFHDLRHTHATLLLKAAVPPHVVAQRLGHASPALTLSIYSHVLPRQQAAAAMAFAALVDKAGNGTDEEDAR